MKRIALAALLTALLIWPDATWSQPPQEKRRLRDRRRDDIEERIHTMKIWKLTDELQLTDEQATHFFPLMNEFDRRQDDIEGKREETLGKLGEIVWDPNPDSKVINQLLDDLETSGDEHIKLRRKFRQDVAGILKPDQMGKLALFNARFPEMLRDMVRERGAERGRPEDLPPGRQRDW
jgi:Spy/CpxP family protein refolding chaperone